MTHEQKPESAALPGLAYFSELITLKRGARSLRDVAPEIGISVATISRIESGKTPDLITFATLCRWLEMSPDVFLARYEPGKPPIKIEQKPESAEFRTHWEQANAISNKIRERYGNFGGLSHVVSKELVEAEARGAAEQRQKDAKGAVAWVDPTFLPSSDYPWTDARLLLEDATKGTIPLYTRPANVAALEDRVKELEETLRNVRASIEQADPKVLVDTLWMPGQPETVVDYISAAIRKGGE